MRIAQVSKADSFGGGASRVAEELSQQLQQHGYFSHHWASWSGKGFDYQKRFSLYGRFEREIRGAHSLVKKAGFPELVPFELLTLLRKKRIDQYDIFHFHDISSAISPVTLGVLSKTKPVVWTIHDCSPFTGGCLYPIECNRFKSGCGQCPQIGQWPIDSRFDATRFMNGIKRRLHKQGKVIPITPSRWMSKLAFSSGMFSTPPHVVPNGVDVDLFRPLDKKQARTLLGIPLDRRIVLLSAGNILDERKGTKFSLQALSLVKKLSPYLLVVGSIDENAKKLLEGFEYCSTGYISDQQKMALVYAAADIFLFPSLADNQPLAILETMACGTPIVGFETGGIPEMVEQNKSGFLVPQRDVGKLAIALELAFKDNRYVGWGVESRYKAEKEYCFEQFIKNHILVYEEAILKKNKEWCQ